MKVLITIAVFISASFGSWTAAADDVKYKDKTEYVFDDDVVTGDLVRPDSEDIVVRQKGKESSLIKIRENFIPEMLKSVEDL